MIYTFLIALFLCTGLTTDSLQLNIWEVYEITLESRVNYGNAYQKVEGTKENDLVTAVFMGVSGDASGREMTITGFWDGGQTWKIRFAPPESGIWEYETISDDPGLNGREEFRDWVLHIKKDH